MTLVGRTTQGINVQRTPWDDADAQNAAAQDQWRMAQFADARLRQGQSDARAMNQDNLNFGVWQSGRSDARDARTTAAQLALEAQRQKQEELMFGKRSGFERQLQQDNWTHGDSVEERRRKQYLEDQANDPLRKLQIDAAGRTIKSGAETDARNAALKAVLATPEGQAAAASGDINALYGMVAKAGASMPADYLLQTMQTQAARKEAAADAKRTRLAREAAGDDPGIRTQALAEIDADPTIRGTIDKGRAAPIAYNPAVASHTTVTRAIDDTIGLPDGKIRQYLTGLNRNELSGGRGDAAGQQLQLAIRSEAARIAQATGVDARSIETAIAGRLQGMDNTGWGAVAKRASMLVPSLGTSELVGDTQSLRASAVDAAMKMLGITQPTE